MSIVPLEVNGQTLQLQCKTKPVLITRKIYDSKFFHDTEYRHEIANHYRDFKNQNRIRRRRKRSVVVRQVRRNQLAENSYEFREVLPVAIMDFPRFFEVYTPRGRQTLCETRPPDETRNDTLRKIRTTETVGGFEFLFNNFYRTSPNQQGRKQDSKKCKPTGSVAPKREGRNPGKEASVAKTTSVDNDDSKSCRRNLTQIDQLNSSDNVRKERHGNVNANAAFYLQLASEYYREGFLKNLKYLDSIGTRRVHAIKIQKSATKQKSTRDSSGETSTTTQQHQYGRGKGIDEHCNANSRPQSAATDTTTISTNNSETDLTTPRKPDAAATHNTSGSLQLARRLLQSFARRKSFRTKFPEDWGQIRVNITPTRQDVNVHEVQQQVCIKEEGVNSRSHTNQTTNSTMNDYMNANETEQKNYSNNSNNNKIKTQQRENFHALIDNLQHLEIGDIDLALPKITLTDYSSSGAYNSSKTTLAHTFTEASLRGSVAGDNNQRRNYKGQQQKQEQQERISNFILKQSKFDFNRSLEIPNENIYHSEARPP